MVRAGKRSRLRTLLAMAAALAVVAPAWPAMAAGQSVSVEVTRKGFLTEYRLPRPKMGPLGIALDGRGGVWVSFDGTPDLSKVADVPGIPLPRPEPNPGLIGRLDPARGTFEYIGAPEGIKPLLLTMGPDGALWVSHAGFQDDLSRKGLARYDPATGAWRVFEHSVPFGSGGLTFDAAGNLWFTDMVNYSIGRLVPSTGEIREFELPYTPTTVGIAPARDGKRLWVAGGSANGLFLFDPATGKAEEYPMPNTFWGPAAVLADDATDGVWTTAHGGNEIALVNAASRAITTQYRAALAEGEQIRPSLPNGLARDSRGQIWVAEHEGNRVARLVPGDKTVNEYVVERQPAWIQWLAVDGEDNVWFAEFGNNTIGRIAPDAPAFSIEMERTSLEVPNSGEVEGTMRISAVGESAGELEMKGLLMPGGVTVSFEPAKVRVEPGKPVEVRYTVRADESATVYTYPFQMGGRGAGVVVSRTLSLAILPKGATPGSGGEAAGNGSVGGPDPGAGEGTDAGAPVTAPAAAPGGGGAGKRLVAFAAVVAALALAAALAVRLGGRRRGGPGAG